MQNKPSGLSAGYGEKVITPPLGVELSGYGFYLERRAEGILDDLKARAIVLAEGAATRLALVSLDLVGLTVAFADGLRRDAAAALDMPTRNVLISCTHTHTGPATQPLRGIGEVDEAYMATLSGAVSAAVVAAARDMRVARLAFAAEAIEPIGYNRREKNFAGIDPFLRTARLARGGQDEGDIFLLNYACHAVTMGRIPKVSADWPGAAVSALERRGHRAVVFQGFCGDIDPVTNLNRWGAGTREDLALYGEIIAARAEKAVALARQDVDPQDAGSEATGVTSRQTPPLLRSAEMRLRVPLAVPSRDRIEETAALFLRYNSGFPLSERFAAEWTAAAHGNHEALAASPFVDDVPIQAMAIGGMKLLAIPGEVFSSYSLDLGKDRPGLFTVGYANGNIGYLPSRSAFDEPGDYACACAPMFYTVFPFTRDLPAIILDAARKVLRSL
jgi:hypothetical protein